MNRKIFITLWIAALLASCSADWEPDMQPCEQQSIRLTAVATATPGQTRAASTDDLQNTAFAAGEDVAVYMVDCDGNPTYTATPYRYRASAAVSGQNELTYYSDATTPSLLCYPIDAASNVDVYAFYPYSRFASIADRETSDLDVTVGTDQSTAANYRASDVMVATPVTDHSRYPKDDNTINLQFRHVMARLVIRLKQGVPAGTTSPITAAELAGTAITIGSVATEATMNMTTGAVTAGDNAATVTVAYNTDLAFYYDNTDAAISTTEYAIVLPAQTLSSTNAITIITGDGETISGTLPDIDLTAGSSTVLTLTVNDSGIEATREGYGNGGAKTWVNYPLLSAATSSDYGKVVCAEGHLHPAKTAVPSGCTAVGILGKVTSTGHGLILALQDAKPQAWSTINSWAGTGLKLLPNDAARGSLASYTTLGETTVSNWCVAQKSDYEVIFTNLGSTTGENGNTYNANVNDYITTGVGGTAISGNYWSATARGGNYMWLFRSSGWGDHIYSVTLSVRPVLAF